MVGVGEFGRPATLFSSKIGKTGLHFTESRLVPHQVKHRYNWGDLKEPGVAYCLGAH